MVLYPGTQLIMIISLICKEQSVDDGFRLIFDRCLLSPLLYILLTSVLRIEKYDIVPL